MNKDEFYAAKPEHNENLYLSSVFETIDGETNLYHAGTWSTFIRLQGCRVGCNYCDTKYSWPIHRGGETVTPAEILRRVQLRKARKVTITGGEPMEQWGPALNKLISDLRWFGYNISMETAGTELLKELRLVHHYVNLIVDFKMQSARTQRDNLTENWPLLAPTDVVKFVVTLDDMRVVPVLVKVLRNSWQCKARMVFSPVWQQQSQLAKFMELAHLHNFVEHDIGLNLQMHKFVWPNNVRDEEGEQHVPVASQLETAPASTQGTGRGPASSD